MALPSIKIEESLAELKTKLLQAESELFCIEKECAEAEAILRQKEQLRSLKLGEVTALQRQIENEAHITQTKPEGNRDEAVSQQTALKIAQAAVEKRQRVRTRAEITQFVENNKDNPSCQKHPFMLLGARRSSSHLKPLPSILEPNIKRAKNELAEREKACEKNEANSQTKQSGSLDARNTTLSP
jgi:hypothetical protein